MTQFLWNFRTFNDAIHTQERLYILTRIPYVNDHMADGELEIRAYVRVEANDVDIFNGLILSCRVVERQGFGSTSVHFITFPQRTLLNCGHPCIVKLTFPLLFDQVSSPGYLLQTRHCLFVAFR